MMNKQVEELVNKTDAWCDANFPPDWLNCVDEFLPQWNQKFAQYIIRECIDIYDEWAEHSSDQQSFRLARHNVQKRFEVE